MQSWAAPGTKWRRVSLARAETEDCLDERNMYIDLGDDPEEEPSNFLDEAVQHAINAGLSFEGARDLREIINRNRSVFD